MAVTFQKATKYQLKARIALLGPAGSGKSYTALRLAFALAGPEGRVAAIDTEHRSLSKYVGEAPDGRPWDFDVLELESFSPDAYIEGIKAAEAAGYSVLVIDSLSHAWAGKDGILEFVDETARKQAMRGGGRENSFAAWREATPKHNELVETMLGAKLHLLVTMRVKTEYVQEKDDKGRTVITKKGLQPVQREGLDYEFDVVCDLEPKQNTMLVSKTRCPALTDKLFEKPGPEVVEIIRTWLESGAPAPQASKGGDGAGAPAAPGGNGQEAGGDGNRWTKIAAERNAFIAFLGAHALSQAEARQIAAEALGLDKPLAAFSEWPHGRQRLQHVLLAWLLRNRPWQDAATHWMSKDDERAAFWAEMGQLGFDEARVHEIAGSTKRFPGSRAELVDFIVNARPEDRGQLPLLEQEEEAFR